MSKRMILLVCSLLVSLVMICAGTVYAEDIALCYDHVDTIYCSLSFENGRAEAWGAVTADRSLPTFVVVELRQYIDGDWRTIGRWRGSTSVGAAEAGGSEEVDHGFDYVVYVEGTVKDTNGNVLETVSGYSNVESY